MDDIEEQVRAKARLRVARLFKMAPESVPLSTKFGTDLRARFVSDFRANEYEQLDRDIKDVAPREVLKQLASGALVIRTVEDYCEHMVRCYRAKPKDVTRLLDLQTPEPLSTHSEHRVQPTAMYRSLDKLLTGTGVVASAFIALLGLGLTAFGFYGFAVGFHGGPVIASIMVLFGAAMAFIGFYCVRACINREV